MRVFFDASILIAAMLSPTGGSSLLISYVKAGKIIGITSQTAIDEVLEKDKYGKLRKTKQEIEQFIVESRLFVRENITEKEIKPYQSEIDKEDAHLIAGAKLTKCIFLVSLDKKHVLHSDIKQKFLPLRIVSPKELLEKIISE